MDDLHPLVLKFALNCLYSFEEEALLSKFSMKEVQISLEGGGCRYEGGSEKEEEEGRKRIFGRLVFLLGEFSNFCKLPSEFKKILDFFENEKVVREFRGSIGEIKGCLFKVKYDEFVDFILADRLWLIFLIF